MVVFVIIALSMLGFGVGFVAGRSGRAPAEVVEKIIEVKTPVAQAIKEIKPPKPGYEYLGETEYFWHKTNAPSEKVEVYFGHFWADPRDMVHGRALTVVEGKYNSAYKRMGLEATTSYYETVPNWLAGGAITSGGIQYPSPWFKAYMLKTHSKEWDSQAKRWIETDDTSLPPLPTTLTADVIDILSERKEKNHDQETNPRSDQDGHQADREAS